MLLISNSMVTVCIMCRVVLEGHVGTSAGPKLAPQHWSGPDQTKHICITTSTTGYSFQAKFKVVVGLAFKGAIQSTCWANTRALHQPKAFVDVL